MRIIQSETTINFKRLETNNAKISTVSKPVNRDFKGIDQIQMSSVGKRMSKIMMASNRFGPDAVKARLEHVDEKFDSLGLDELDLEIMSREELEEKLGQVEEIIHELRPNANINLTDIDGKTDEELKASLNKVINRVDNAKDDLSTVKTIVTDLFGEETGQVSEMPSEEIVPVEDNVMDDMIMDLELIDGDEL